MTGEDSFYGRDCISTSTSSLSPYSYFYVYNAEADVLVGLDSRVGVALTESTLYLSTI